MGIDQRPTLLLITSHFPFAGPGGETAFLAPEVHALARRGEFRLVVAPLRRGNRLLPFAEEVTLDESLSDDLRRGLWLALLRAWCWPGFTGEMMRAVRQGGLLGVARTWRWAAFADVVYRWLQRLPRQQAVLGYTYWRGGATLALLRWAAEAAGRRAAITRVHGHDLYEEAFNPPFQPWTLTFHEVEFTATVADQARDYLLARGVPASRVVVARLGTVRIERASSSADGQWRVLSCSFLRPAKRVRLVARALVRLARTLPSQRIVWVHFGGDEGEGKEEAAAIAEALAHRPDNIRVELRGTVTGPEVHAHYAEHPVDLFVHLSASEGLPVSVMEALGAGVPVVATDVGGTREAVNDLVGRLLPADPPVDVVADAIRSVLEAPVETRRAMREAAATQWGARFDAQKQHAAFAGVLAARMEGMVPR